MFNPKRNIERPSIEENMVGHDPRVKPVCPYCGANAVLVHSRVVYGNGRDYGNVWVCSNYPTCDAYVGVHRSTNRPLGRLANRRLRNAKMTAHDAFDPIWKEKILSRSAAYGWLAEQMEIPVEQCHIGMFDVGQCRKVVQVVSRGIDVLRERKRREGTR